MRGLLFVIGHILTVQSVFGSLDARAIRASHSYREARARGAEASFLLRVSDDEDVVVSNASVKAFFDMITSVNTSEGVTDADGVCVLKNKTRGNNIALHVTKDGYYQSSKSLCLASMTAPHEVLDGEWQPVPMVEPIKLRKIRTYAELVNFAEILPVPVTNQWFGFDLRKGCFSTNNDSTLRTDVEFFVEWDGKPPMTSRFCKLKMRFPENGSGGYYSSLVSESAFPFAYRAMENADFKVTTLEIVDRDGSPHATEIPFRRGSELIARIRCEFDEKNKLVSANYCSIKAVRVSPSWDSLPTLRFVYSFNPIVNDTNLEVKSRRDRSEEGVTY